MFAAVVAARNFSTKFHAGRVDKMPPLLKKLLVIADFDHTIIDANSDIYVKDLLPGGVVSDEIEHLYTKRNWTRYMGEIFKRLHANGVGEADLKNHVACMPLAPGMDELISFLRRRKSDVESAIISDSNSTFIGWILADRGAEDGVFDRVFTNPASFDADGRLEIAFYHEQDWCDLSTINMCKGHIMDEFVAERRRAAPDGVDFEKIVYIGDGANDLCPALRLAESDLVFARRDYALHKMVLSKAPECAELKATVVPYDSGREIVERLSKLFD
ncbi:pyridoxal phosphate phosphatase PHOSPHO2-like [Tubulanus polymorphus]|uniref:pyridoxal phosphate phosphatase PHOSPHO2-like n=1 Tax=Tubulanus polymorphus TaxID=672921 RepID=UPI003DA256B9